VSAVERVSFSLVAPGIQALSFFTPCFMIDAAYRAQCGEVAMPKMLSLAEASALLAIQPCTLRRLCNAGRVPGAIRKPRPYALNDPWYVPAQWVRAEVVRRKSMIRKRGAPYRLAILQNATKSTNKVVTGQLASETNQRDNVTGRVTLCHST
jgi:hypothetical protein